MRVRVLLLLLSAAASVSAEEKATGKAGVNELHQLSEKLRQNAGADWTSLTEHKFADELATCTIDKEVLGHYLIQDHRFLDAFTMLLASMLVDAPTLEDRIPGAQFLGLITSKERI
jgi:thiaminase/transcriptional activator TenA|tara:strand:+ start:981 stop:1328 length:348 start_codon:yes stop_codon:yes gene_type:complete